MNPVKLITMRKFFTLLFLIASLPLWAQQVRRATLRPMRVLLMWTLLLQLPLQAEGSQEVDCLRSFPKNGLL